MNEDLDLSLKNVVQNTHNIVSLLTLLSGKLQELFGIMTGGKGVGDVTPLKVEWHWANFGFTVHIIFEEKASILSVAIEEPECQTPWLAERLTKAQDLLVKLNKMFGGKENGKRKNTKKED